MAGSPALSVRAWHAADALFHTDARWRGSDDAYSIPLDDSRILWLFGDTFISSNGERRGSTMIENSVAVQRGTDPASASIDFHWRECDGVAAPFFADQEGLVLWPLDGCRIADRLLLFFVAVRRTGGGPFDFVIVGSHAVLVENPDDEPPQWVWRTVRDARHAQPAVGWTSSVVASDGYLHLFGYVVRDGRGRARSGDVGVARTPFEAARSGDIGDAEVWTGARRGWVRESLLGDRGLRPATVFPDGATEFSVRWVPSLGCYVQAQATVRGGDLGIRCSERLLGPWPETTAVYRPPERDRPNVFLYAYKAHCELAGADMVITYASNSRDASVFWDESIYWPRFLAVDVADVQHGMRYRPES